jgi:hypothetical protein
MSRRTCDEHQHACGGNALTLLLPGPTLLKVGLECHPLPFRRDCLRQNEHHLPPEGFLEELAGGSG